MDEPWTLVVIAVCACFMLCTLLFTIIRCCLCSYKGMKTYKKESDHLKINYDYYPEVIINANRTPAINNSQIQDVSKDALTQPINSC